MPQTLVLGGQHHLYSSGLFPIVLETTDYEVLLVLGWMRSWNAANLSWKSAVHFL